MKNLFLHILFVALLGSNLLAQEIPADSLETEVYVEEDSVNLPSDPPRTFGLVFNRGFMYQTNGFKTEQDTVPVAGTSSGTYFIGAGFMVPFGDNTLGLRLTPGYAWTIYDYAQSSSKTFPTSLDENEPLVSEKHRLGLIELPVGLYWNITKDEDNDPLVFAEIGGYAGYMLSAQYLTERETGVRTRVLKDKGLEQEGDFQRVRYGAYLRLGYKWAALYASYRISDVFDTFSDASVHPDGYVNPRVAPLEIGLSLMW
ncbi:MAG: outer membrane beta-barrel protein [Bacteroidota bacterium]